jgi:hypothetical protein
VNGCRKEVCFRSKARRAGGQNVPNVVRLLSWDM